LSLNRITLKGTSRRL